MGSLHGSKLDGRVARVRGRERSGVSFVCSSCTSARVGSQGEQRQVAGEATGAIPSWKSLPRTNRSERRIRDTGWTWIAAKVQESGISDRAVIGLRSWSEIALPLVYEHREA